MGCVQTLKGVKTDCEGNLGGIKTVVYIANKDDVKTVTLASPNNDTIETITMESGKYFVPFEFRKQTGSLTSTWTIDDVNGVKFCTSELSLKFAKQDSTKRVEMQALMLGEFVAIVEDQNGVKHYIGYDNPVTASAGGSTTGTASTDANEYTITLQDISKEYPFEYTGVMDTLLAPTATE